MRSFTAQPRRRQSMLIVLLVVPCLALAVACDRGSAPAPASNTNAPATARGPLQPRTALPLPPVAPAHGPGGSAPDATRASAQSWTLLDGRRARATDYKGKVLVLDFWATYCPPCRDEVPHLIALQKRYGAQGLHVVGLNVGGEEDRPKVPDFVQEFKIQYALGYPDDELAAAVFAQTDAIPQTYVFDRNGRLVKRFVGFDGNAAVALESAVQAALATKPTGAGDD
jgi:thiol-disulfide isomerase/thioredoxin